MFMDWKNQYSENEYTTQSNLQVQCNPYQIANGVFHGLKTKMLTICKKIQNIPNSQRVLRKKNGAGGMRLPNFSLYYRSIVTRAAWFWQKSETELSGIE